MTGTPITNSPLEAWPLFTWLNPGSLGRFYSFASFYMAPTGFSMFGAIRTDRLSHLAGRLQPYYIRRSREELLPDLPELLEQTIPVELSDKEKKLYDQLKKELLFEIEKSAINKIDSPHTIQNGIVKFLRLRECADSLELLGESNKSSKMEALKELLDTYNIKH